MGNDIKGLIITFSDDKSEEDVEDYIKLLDKLDGVVDVSVCKTDANSIMDRKRVKHKLIDVLNDAISDF